MIKTASRKKTRVNTRFSLRNRASHAAPSRSVSMGTNAKIMVLIRTELSVSMGPTATASASAALCVPSR